MLVQQLVRHADQDLCIVSNWDGPQSAAVIICPGLATTMSEPRYFLSILARRCHELGLNAFQFDYAGDGDSTGDFADVTLRSILSSAEQVGEFVESLGCSRIGLIGYGIGNLVAASLLQRSTVKTAILISPHSSVFTAQGRAIWEELGQLCQPGQADPVYPQVEHQFTSLGTLWRAIVGEAVVPAQPCGPLSADFLWELGALSIEQAFPYSDKPILVVSDEEEDAFLSRHGSSRFKLIQHESTQHKPSWHWCVDCRESILTHITDWFQDRIPVSGLGTNPDRDCRRILHEECDQHYQPGKIAQMHPVTISVADGSMLGILHVPAYTSNLKKACVIYEPGVPGQRVDIHRCGPRLANALVAKGFYVFRYDSRGTGVSSGEFHDFTWSRKLEDAMHVLEQLMVWNSSHIDRFVILGNSSGARTACLVANRNAKVCAAVLWGPIMVEPSERVGEGIVKRHSTGDLVTEYCGLWLGIRYNLDERRYDFLHELERCRKPLLIIFGTDEENQSNQDRVQEIALSHPEKDLLKIQGEHGFAPESMTDVISSTVDWLMKLVQQEER